MSKSLFNDDLNKSSNVHFSRCGKACLTERFPTSLTSYLNISIAAVSSSGFSKLSCRVLSFSTVLLSLILACVNQPICRRRLYLKNCSECVRHDHHESQFVENRILGLCLTSQWCSVLSGKMCNPKNYIL